VLADAIPAHVFYPEDFEDDTLARRLRWDGFAFSCDGDPTLLILLNPARPETRQTATLMEELSHHLLRHKPCSIALNPSTGFLERSYDPSQEAEAYDLGAAILLPVLAGRRRPSARPDAVAVPAICDSQESRP